MAKKEEKFTRAAHIKRHTVGTSNEISFSVLDAAKNSLDAGKADKEDKGPRFGRIALFTLPGRRKKPVATPAQEKGLPLSTGDFVSVESKDGSSRFDTLDFLGTSGKTSGAGGTSGTVKAASSSMSSSATPGAFGMSSSSSRSFSGTSASPQRSPEEEIARRKARRRLSKVLSITVIAVVSIALLAVGGTYLYRDYQHQQSNVAVLDDALELVQKADNETLIPLDKVVANPFAADAEQNRVAVIEGLDQASQYLVEADTKARETSQNLRESRDKEAANQTVATISARQALVESGKQLMAEAQAAQSAIDYVQDAWEEVLQADDKARSAAALVTETTVEHVEASKSKTAEALDAFAQARAHLEDAQVTYPDADLTLLFNYVDKRIESLGYAIASDDAFLAKNKEEAATQNDLYNTADAEAVALAKELPPDLSSIIVDAYDAATVDMAKSYSTARSQAGTADAFINDYLGTEVK